MPKTSRPSRPYDETAVAQRIAVERERIGLTHERLAARLRDDHGVADVDKAALWKIEKGQRRIRAAELVALAQVFATTVKDLLLPAEVVGRRDAQRLIDDYLTKEKAAAAAILTREQARAAIAAFAEQHPELSDVLSAYADARSQDAERDALSAQMSNLVAQMLAEADDDTLRLAARLGLIPAKES